MTRAGLGRRCPFPAGARLDRIARQTLQHPKGVLYALIGYRAVQGIEEVLGVGLAQAHQHGQAEGMAAVQVLERRKLAVDVVVCPVAVARAAGWTGPVRREPRGGNAKCRCSGAAVRCCYSVENGSLPLVIYQGCGSCPHNDAAGPLQSRGLPSPTGSAE